MRTGAAHDKATARRFAITKVHVWSPRLAEWHDPCGGGYSPANHGLQARLAWPDGVAVLLVLGVFRSLVAAARAATDRAATAARASVAGSGTAASV